MKRSILAALALLLAVAAGLALYAWRLQRKVQREEGLATQQAPAPASGGALTPVTLYVASDSDGAVHRSQLEVVLPPERSERARAVLRALLAQYLQPGSAHPIGAGADIRDVYLLKNDAAVVDTNTAFAQAHPSGVLAEELTIASMVATLHANDNQIQRVKILVNGAEYETLAGHADLHRFYLAGNLGPILKEMQ